MSLIKQLVEKGIIDQGKADSVEREIKQSGRSEEDALLGMRVIPEEVLFSIKAKNLKIPFKQVNAEEVPLNTLELIPEETVKNYEMIPLLKTDKILEIGMVHPEDFGAQESLKFLSRHKKFNYEVFLITPTNFSEILKQYRNLKKEVGRALDDLEKELEAEKEKNKPKSSAEFQRIAEEAPITKIVAVILRHAVEGCASDIHIEPTRQELRIRFRLLGSLHASIFLPIRIHPAVIARIKILSDLKIDESRMPQDGRFSTKIDNKSIDFRVSSFPTALGEKIAIRVLDPSAGLKSFEDLGVTGRNLEILKEGAKKPCGLLLITGPTGSGKTTTLYTILGLLNREDVNIVTLEDPVEYFIEGINQSQVKPEIGYDFPSGLRHILRQDPDIIMVGEIRDEETASLVIHAALTGHLVISTLHTTNTFGVIPRMIDMGIKPYLLPPTLQLAMAQRLVRKLCFECRKEITPDVKIKNLILKELRGIPQAEALEEKYKNFKLYRQKGCKKCNSTGFSGRIGIFESLAMTTELADLTLGKLSETDMKKEAERQKMLTMRQDGILKVLAGETTIEEVLRVTEE